MADLELWDEVDKSGAASSVQLSLFLDSVQDLPSFVRFIDALHKDREDADRKEAARSAGSHSSWNGWENGSIADFLEAAVAWATTWTDDSRRGDPAHLVDENPWKAAARIIYAGKYYE
ncbi:hypothetical protein [Mesorhizobium sp.]|uniref:DUF7660 family protein n=1 Tax=Mesorhizobium sp. TaxID=1871066 RepID=UPI000FEA6556|nr:hypothetical protein [Mesorhizobium sp.]RWD68120.1 MAG: hypothetical protein EOS37_22005 [Mesorhizobium sp.]TIV56327.1 MAG: hypothetical protein E5V80_27295 [Mesorhizobium sp.]